MTAATGLLDRELRPVENRARWIAWGLALQAVGVGIPITAALRRANKDGVGGTLTHYTVRLVWHEMLRSRADIALIALGVALFAAGGIVLARPCVRRPVALFIVTPLAATLGFAVLGVIALLCAAVIALAEFPGDFNWADLMSSIGWPGDSDRRNRRKSGYRSSRTTRISASGGRFCFARDAVPGFGSGVWVSASAAIRSRPR